jgi:hypothetical protein
MGFTTKGACMNLCKNPGMQVWQNDATLPAMTPRTPLADGWLYGGGPLGPIVFAGAQSASVPCGHVTRSLEIACTTANTTPGPNTEHHLRWAVYGHDFAPWANSNLKVKFAVFSPKAGIHSVAALNEMRTRTFINEYVVNTPNTWEVKELTFPMGSKTGTWNLGDGYGVGFRWALVATSGFTAAPGAWQNGNFVGSPNQVNLGDSTSNVFRISQVQICAEECPDFVLPDYDTALRDAYRQYRVINTDIGTYSVNFDVPLAFAMMAPPNISFKGVMDTDIGLTDANGGTVITGATLSSWPRSKHFAKWSLTKTGALVGGGVYNTRIMTPNGKIVIDGHL